MALVKSTTPPATAILRKRDTLAEDSTMQRAFFAAIVASAMGIAACLPAQADGPDYDGTVAYIKSRVSGSLSEQQRCVFKAKVSSAAHEGTFHAGKLDIVPTVISPSEVHFECVKGAQCIALPDAKQISVVNFGVHDDAQGVAIAISRLVEMCGPGGGGH